MENRKEWLEDEIEHFIIILEEDLENLDEDNFMEVINEQIDKFKEIINGKIKNVTSSKFWTCHNCNCRNFIDRRWCNNCGEDRNE